MISLGKHANATAAGTAIQAKLLSSRRQNSRASAGEPERCLSEETARFDSGSPT